MCSSDLFLAPPVAQFSTPSAQALVQDRLRSESMGAVPLFDMRRIRRFADALYTHPAGTRAASEPILMTLLSASLVQSRLMER